MKDHIFNIAGDVGAIQTGDNSTANVTMHSASERIESALSDIEAALVACGGSDTVEAVDAVREAREELRRPQPRLAVLSTLLYSIAITVQTIGVAEPALQALRDGAKILGIPLP